MTEQKSYHRHGECKQCGWCCNGGAPMATFFWKLVDVSDLLYFGGFGCEVVLPIGKKPSDLKRGDTIAVTVKGIRCEHLNEDNTCKIYKQRPYQCGMFPFRPIQIEGNPKCGYSFEKVI